jgi:hypothetical protein
MKKGKKGKWREIQSKWRSNVTELRIQESKKTRTAAGSSCMQENDEN